MGNAYMDLVAALRLPSHALFCEAVKTIGGVNVRTDVGGGNILHFLISALKKEGLRVEDFETLLDLGADPNAANKEGHTPLHYAVMHPFSLELTRVLLAHHAIVDSQDLVGNTPLWRAVMGYRGENERLEIILLLLSQGTDIHQKNNVGISARDVIVRREESIFEGGARAEWGLMGTLSAYLGAEAGSLS